MGKATGPARASTHDPSKLGRRFKQLLRSEEVILGGIIFEIIRTPIVKLYRQAGFDFIYADNEHVHMSGLPAMGDFILCARDNQLPVIAKVPELGRPEVARLLEAGVVGIQLPRTESREDLETLIDYMKFPPLGTRAGAPLYGNVDYVWPADSRKWLQDANDSTVVMAHIETRKGFENFEQIVSTPHLDMVYVGPFDFSISMGQPGDYDHPDVRGPMEHILELCLKHDVPFGTTASGTEAAARWIALGARFFEVVDELSLIARGAAQTVDEYRIAVKTVRAVKDYIKG